MLKAIARERGLNHCPTPNTGTKLHPQQTGLTFVRSQTALRVPIQEVLDIFTKHYFLYVHPCLPVVDEAVFWRKYRSVDASAGKISTLLFQAMLFAASPVLLFSFFSFPFLVTDEYSLSLSKRSKSAGMTL